MATTGARPKLLAIVGPTASGKSELAMRLAKSWDGEIIAADSRAIYRDMNIGTAKPSASDRKKVQHRGLDLVKPGQNFSASRFKNYANQKIADIQSRGKLPILVGGTGLYIDSVIFDFGFRAPGTPGLRQKLEAMNLEELRYIIEESGLKMPENSFNRRHLVRTIEAGGQVAARRAEPLPGCLIIGLGPRDWTLKRRIRRRAKTNFNRLITETKKLRKDYGEAKLRQTAGIPYLVALDYLDGRLSRSQALHKIQTAEWQYARRQKTWFKRNPYIKWFSSAQKAFEATR